MSRALRLAVFLAAAVAVTAFVSTPLSLRTQGAAHACSWRVHGKLGVAVPKTSRPARVAMLRMEAGAAPVAEECDGPAKEGAVGNVDVKAAKISTNDIKTDGILNLSPSAVKQIANLSKDKGNGLVLRVGVRAGGCSGMSYVMEFEDDTKLQPTDTAIPFDNFKLVVDPKSLMFIYGMTLDYSDALIGGGFKFNNPNAESTCGCGQSFGT